jgi:serine/threonine protein kinase
MAPEQARGKPLDKRADIRAFGVVLYEMLSGRRLFEGETISDTLAGVLTRQPDWVPVPPKAQRLLKTCLEKAGQFAEFETACCGLSARSNCDSTRLRKAFT